MCKVFTKILPCGVPPALSQHISRVSELGIFENQCVSSASSSHIPELSGSENLLFQILPMLSGQNFFQTLTTRVVESALLRVARNLSREYVCIRI